MALPLIESPKNPRIVALARLLEARARREAGLFLLEGWRLVRAALIAEAPIEEIYATRAALEREGAGSMVASLMTRGDVEIIEISEAVARRLSDTVAPQGIVAVARRLEARLDALLTPPAPLIVAADAIADPGNFGALARVAAAADADALVVLPGCVDWTSPKVLRASMGAVFQVPIVPAPLDALLQFIKRRQIALAITSGALGQPIDEADLTRGLVIAFGNEAHGVGEALTRLAAADFSAEQPGGVERLTIPMPGEVESLNVATAAGIILFEALRQRRRRGSGDQRGQ